MGNGKVRQERQKRRDGKGRTRKAIKIYFTNRG